MSKIENLKERASAWATAHYAHVMRLVDEAKREGAPATEPSGSDRIRPELWKGIHWRWFFDLDWKP